MNREQPTVNIALPAPSFREAFRFWLKLGFISFGGPAGQIAIMHTELVERKKWIEEGRFLHALNFCMLLPGPEATQLAIYCGWLLHGIRGGIIAGILFVLPAAFILLGLSYAYAAYGHVPWISAIFYGLKPAVTAIVASALIRVGRRALKTPALCAIAAIAFVGIFFLKVPFPMIVIGAAFLGFLGGRFAAKQIPSQASLSTAIGSEAPTASHKTRWGVSLFFLFLWWLPVLLGMIGHGRNKIFAQEGLFFSKAALVTFGGAYAVLPYVAQQAVVRFHWLTWLQMVDGLALAETTPGPLIMVVQFVGFMGGWSHPGGWSRAVAGTVGALVATWTTFMPCFLWVFLGAPYIDHLRNNKSLDRILTCITASVVGVILNLSVWFALNVFRPIPGKIDWFALCIASVAFIGMQRFKIGMGWVIFMCATAGLLYWSVEATM